MTVMTVISVADRDVGDGYGCRDDRDIRHDNKPISFMTVMAQLCPVLLLCQ